MSAVLGIGCIPGTCSWAGPPQLRSGCNAQRAATQQSQPPHNPSRFPFHVFLRLILLSALVVPAQSSSPAGEAEAGCAGSWAAPTLASRPH